MSNTPGPSPAFPVGALLVLSGIVTLFFRPGTGLGLIALGAVILYVGYRLQGGANNPNLYRNPDRVSREWDQKYRK